MVWCSVWKKTLNEQVTGADVTHSMLAQTRAGNFITPCPTSPTTQGDSKRPVVFYILGDCAAPEWHLKWPIVHLSPSRPTTSIEQTERTHCLSPKTMETVLHGEIAVPWTNACSGAKEVQIMENYPVAQRCFDCFEAIRSANSSSISVRAGTSAAEWSSNQSHWRLKGSRAAAWHRSLTEGRRLPLKHSKSTLQSTEECNKLTEPLSDPVHPVLLLFSQQGAQSGPFVPNKEKGYFP